MNIDANVQKILFALLRRWHLLVIFALIGALLGYAYTHEFTTETYTSTVKYLAYATDGNDDVISSSSSNEQQRVSNTSKMNYAMKMLPTYITIFQTNEFAQRLASDMNETYNSNYQPSSLIGTMEIKSIADTAMFEISVTTDDDEFSYKIAQQLETTIPEVMKEKNNGLVQSSVEDKAIKAASAGSLGYPKKCLIGASIGIVLAAAYIILRTLLDVRIKTSEELTEKYSIPVLGSIPNYESRSIQVQSSKGVDGYVKEN